MDSRTKGTVGVEGKYMSRGGEVRTEIVREIVEGMILWFVVQSEKKRESDVTDT